jgi:hypothetical protein
VLVQTVRKSLWFASLLLSSGACSAAQNVVEPVELTVSVHNDANVPAGAMASAEVAASRIFRHAGLAVKWVTCVPPLDPTLDSAPCSKAAFPSHLQVRIVSKPQNLTNSTFGVSYLADDGTGCYSDIFFSRIANLYSSSGQEIGPILGHVMAHEIAHLLLGINAHSSFGIMRARWQREELLKASKGELLFTQQQSRVMRQRLSLVAGRTVGD